MTQSHDSALGADPTRTPPSTGALLGDLSEQTSHLLRSEIQLAKVEVKASLTQAVAGAGMFGAAGVIALYGLGVLIAAAVLALALALPAWLSAVIVGVVLLVIALVAALAGRSRARRVTPIGERSKQSVSKDVNEVKKGAAS